MKITCYFKCVDELSLILYLYHYKDNYIKVIGEHKSDTF